MKIYKNKQDSRKEMTPTGKLFISVFSLILSVAGAANKSNSLKNRLINYMLIYFIIRDLVKKQ